MPDFQVVDRLQIQRDVQWSLVTGHHLDLFALITCSACLIELSDNSVAFDKRNRKHREVLILAGLQHAQENQMIPK